MTNRSRRAIKARFSPPGLPSRNQGAALLIMLSILMFVIATTVITRFSLNRMHVERNNHTAEVLNLARESLLGYAIRQPVIGTLPCPDTDGDGEGDDPEDWSGTTCTNDVGLLPYRTLGLDELKDGSGNSLWYAVEPRYTSVGSFRNSSIPSSYSLDGLSVVAIIIAPGSALANQQRNSLAIGDHLEGENANSDDIYTRVEDNLHNDKLLGIAEATFWTLMEKKVLQDAAKLLSDYKTACGEYPWAASFATGVDDISMDLLQSGSLPLDTALPDNWNTGCATGISPPPLLQEHWRDQIYYTFCTLAEGNCIQLMGDNTANVEAVVIAPGARVALQNRSVGSINDYYEDENATPGPPYKFLFPRNLDGNFNDSLHVVSP